MPHRAPPELFFWHYNPRPVCTTAAVDCSERALVSLSTYVLWLCNPTSTDHHPCASVLNSRFIESPGLKNVFFEINLCWFLTLVLCTGANHRAAVCFGRIDKTRDTGRATQYSYGVSCRPWILSTKIESLLSGSRWMEPAQSAVPYEFRQSSDT